jgi:hypothetical protein
MNFALIQEERVQVFLQHFSKQASYRVSELQLQRDRLQTANFKVDPDFVLEQREAVRRDLKVLLTYTTLTGRLKDRTDSFVRD